MSNPLKPFFAVHLRKFSLILALVMLFAQLFAGISFALEDRAAEADPKISNIGVIVDEAIEGAVNRLNGEENLSDWAAIALVKAGYSVPESYVNSIKTQIQENSGLFQRVTDLQRISLTLGILGHDPSKYEGFNLIEHIFNHDRMLNQGINGPIYALVVLNSGNYQLSSSSKWSQANLIEIILQQQNSDGGWSLTQGGKSTVDITAMAITALAGFMDEMAVKPAIDKAIAWLSKVQLDSGGFNDSGDNSQSVAQVVIALSTLKLDSQLFKKTGNALEHLLSFKQADGGFAHMSGLGTNGMATEQALLALLAYKSFQSGTGVSIYQAADSPVRVEIRIEGPDYAVSGGLVEGNTALEALEALAAVKGIELGIADTSFGKYVRSIGQIAEMRFDGNGGWSYNVKRNGHWLFPMVGMADFQLLQDDVIVVYYTDYTTQMIERVIVDPETLKTGRPFTVKVEKSYWDWNEHQAVVSPASGVRVQLGAQAAMTNEQGVADFSQAVRAGSFNLVVSGYQEGSAPSVVRHTQPVIIKPAEVSATVAVEGLDSRIADGHVKAETALDALLQILETNQIQYNVQDSSFGKYVDQINHLTAGALGGYDGWMYLVKRGGSWIFPAVGIDSFFLEAGDHVVSFYSDNTNPIQSISFQPQQPKANEPFSIIVNQAEWDWSLSESISYPASGVQVEVGGRIATTDELGHAYFEQGLPLGKHMVTVTGYRENNAPSIVRESIELFLYHDQLSVSAWAAESVQKALAYGLMQGISDKEIVFQPQRSITRAEYITLLLKLMGEEPINIGVQQPYQDVPVTAWYAGAIAKAKQLGIIEGGVNFQPNAPLIREDMAVLTAKAFELSTKHTVVFSDLYNVNITSLPFIYAVADTGILVGSNGEFMPAVEVSREMAAAVAVRIYER